MQYGLWNNINVYLPNSGLFNDIEYTFMKLPLVHMVRINGKDQPERCLMAVHGGIPFYPRDFSQMPQIPKLFDGGIILDSQYSTVDEMDVLSKQILWSDPVEELPPNTYFLPSRRGIGYEFGEAVFSQWMAENQVDRAVRSHEVFLTGHHEYFHNRFFSIFSASNYGSQEIDAVILEFDLEKPWDQNWNFLKVKDLPSN
jgi:hypothetical protein